MKRRMLPMRLYRWSFCHAFVAAAIVAGPMGPCGTCRAAGRIVISEVMYNPASDEDRGQSEWVEIANVGDAPIVLAGWRLDDEDKLPMDDWGTFTCTLGPGGIAVLVNAAAVDEVQFRAAWDPEAVPAPPESAVPNGLAAGVHSYVVLPVKWGGISNSPGDGNEVLRLLDADNQVMCTVALGNGGDWPKLSQAGGPSVYLTNPYAAPSPTSAPSSPTQPTDQSSGASTTGDGRNAPNRGGEPTGAGTSAGAATSGTSGSGWRASSLGEAGARECRRTAVYNGRDIGSPGRLPTRLAPPVTPAASTSASNVAPTSGPTLAIAHCLSCNELVHVDTAGCGTMLARPLNHSSHAMCERTLASP